MAKLKNAIWLQIVLSLFANASDRSHLIATYYEAQDWQRFFVQSFLLRSQVKKQLLNSQKIESSDISILVLEVMAYLRHCQFAMAAQVLHGLELVVKRQESKDDLRVVKADILYLRALLSASALRKQGRAAENQVKVTAISIPEKGQLWSVPEAQKKVLHEEMSIAPHLISQVKNMCTLGLR